MRSKVAGVLVYLLLASMILVPQPAVAATGLNETAVQEVVNAVKTELSTLSYESEEVRAKIAPSKFSITEITYKKIAISKATNKKITEITNEEATAELQKEYLQKAGYKEAFAEVQKNLESLLSQLIASDSQFNSRTAEEYKTLIKKDKAALLLGLAYEQRLYDFDYENTNFAQALRKSGSFGKAFSPLDLAINLGKQGGDQYALVRNIDTFEKIIAPAVINGKNLETFLTSVVPSTKVQDWYVQQLTLHGNVVTENASKEIPDGDYRLYDKLTGSKKLQPYLLPLLTRNNNSVFIMSNIASVSWGMREGYVEDPNNNAKMEEFRQKVAAYGKNQADYIDFWARMAPEHKDALKADRIVTDGYRVAGRGSGENAWSPESGETATEAVKDFFGPMKRWTGYKFIGAEASGSDVTFWTARLLEPTGHSAYTHELTHQLAQNGSYPYLNGQKYRSGTSTELYPRGLYESYDQNDPIYMLNQIMDWSKDGYGNSSVNIFDGEESVRNYLTNLLDTTNTLDLIEAEEVLKRDAGVKQKWFNVVKMTENKTSQGKYDETFTASTAEQATAWDSVADLVDANAVVSRYEAVGTNHTGTAEYNGYHVVPLFSPLYGAPLAPNGMTGDIHMRRIAWELMGEYGYKKGWVPYLSNQYKPASATADEAFADAEIIKQISAYTSDAQLRKAMYDKRAKRLAELKDVTVTWNNQQVTISDEATLRRLMNEAIDTDLADNRSGVRAKDTAVEKLKSAIYLGYKKLTNEFETTIYEAPQPEVKTYKLAYQFTGEVPAGVIAPVDETAYETGDSVTLTIPATTETADGNGVEGTWRFNGWKVDGQGENITALTVADKNITLIGTWTFIPAPEPDVKQNIANEPAWTVLYVEAGSSVSGDAPIDTAGNDGFPEGTTFTWVSSPQYAATRAWVAVDQKTGVITASPAQDQAAGDYIVRIDVIYPDQSFDVVNARVTVSEKAVDPQPEPDPQPGPDPQPEPDPGTDPEPGPGIDPQPGPEPAVPTPPVLQPEHEKDALPTSDTAEPEAEFENSLANTGAVVLGIAILAICLAGVGIGLVYLRKKTENKDETEQEDNENSNNG